MDSEITYYRQLQEYLDKLPIGYPKTNSGVELRILQLLFKPIEVKVALCLSLLEKTKEKIPPRNVAMLYLGILSDKVSKRKMMGNMLKLLTGKQLF